MKPRASSTKKRATKTPVVAKPRKPAAAKPASRATADPRLEALARLFAGEPRVTLGKAFSSITLKVDGKIFAMVVKDKLVFKLPKARVDELVGKGAGRYFEPGPGRVMKEWLSLDAPRPAPSQLAREAFGFVVGQI